MTTTNENLPDVLRPHNAKHALVTTFVNEYKAAFEADEEVDWVLRDIVIDLLHVLAPAFLAEGAYARELPDLFDGVLMGAVSSHWVEETPLDLNAETVQS